MYVFKMFIRVEIIPKFQPLQHIYGGFITHLVLSTSELGVIHALVRGSSLSDVTGPRG